ncbi:MAG TPA: TldD/PmbA family protein, partial [Syntrophales bacterium]|nr:TldD/PmbA family protein [Syntrophales bacterium]
MMAGENLAAVTETAMKRLKEKKASDFVVSASRTGGSEIKFVNNEIVKTSISNDVELSIFAVFGKKIVLTSVKELESSKIKEAIEKLSKFSLGAMPKDDYFGIADGPFKYKPVKRIYDKKIPNLSASGQVDYVEAGVNAALAQGAARASGIFELQQNSTYLRTSRNVAAESEKTQAYFSIRALVDKDASGHNTSAACMLRDFDASKTGASAGEIARLSQKPEKGKSGKYDIIFAPLALAPLLSIAGNASSIFSVEAGFSFFKDRINTSVASPSVTLTDNGPLEGAYGATPFDSEGVPTQKNTLIDGGKFKTYLYNTSFSRKYK